MKSLFVLNYLKIFKVVHKNNPRTHSPQQNKKAMLTTAVYIHISLYSHKVAETKIALRLS